MPVVGLDTWAIIVALAGAVAALWKYAAAQNDKASAAKDEVHARELADRDKQITALLAAVDKQSGKIDELQDALIGAAATARIAKVVVEGKSQEATQEPG